MNDIEKYLLENVQYSAKHGTFKKRHSGFVITPRDQKGYQNYNIVIENKKDNILINEPAWRVAFLLTDNVFPNHFDTVKFKDGNTNNFEFNNLELIKYFEDDMSIVDFCFDHNLRYGTVLKIMRDSKCVYRQGKTCKSKYYLKSDLMAKCKHLFVKETRNFTKKPKPNYKIDLHDLTRQFLSTHFITPTRWGMTL